MFRLTEEELEAFEVPNWNLKQASRRSPVPVVRLHRAGRCDAGQRSQQPPRPSGVDRNCPGVCEAPRHTRSSHRDARRLEELERNFEKHDSELHYVFEAIRELMAPEPVAPKRRIGFSAQEKPDDDR
jgi:hypothetical protein